MKGIAKSLLQPGVYFVVDATYGIHFLASGTLKQCRTYCKEHGIPTKIRWEL